MLSRCILGESGDPLNAQATNPENRGANRERGATKRCQRRVRTVAASTLAIPGRIRFGATPSRLTSLLRRLRAGDETTPFRDEDAHYRRMTTRLRARETRLMPPIAIAPGRMTRERHREHRPGIVRRRQRGAEFERRSASPEERRFAYVPRRTELHRIRPGRRRWRARIARDLTTSIEDGAMPMTVAQPSAPPPRSPRAPSHDPGRQCGGPAPPRGDRQRGHRDGGDPDERAIDQSS